MPAHIFHEDANGVRGSIVWVRHDKIAVLETCRLCYLPVQACRDIDLATIIVRVIHRREIEDDVPDLTIELILADIPLSAIATWDIDIGIDGLTPLHWAVFKGDIDCIRSLLEAKSVVDAKAFEGWVPLHYAFKVKGREQAIIRLLKDHGADLNLADNNNQAPLHYSVKSGSIDGARCLLDLGADLEIRDNQGFTPFAKTVQQNEAGLVRLFLSRGAKVDGLTKDGQSTLHLAALYAGIDIMRLMI